MAGEPTKVCRFPVFMTGSRIDHVLASASPRHSRAMAIGSRYLGLAHPEYLGLAHPDAAVSERAAS